MGERTSEEQEQAVLGAIALVVVLGVVWLALDTFLLGGDGDVRVDARGGADGTTSTPSPTPTPPPPVSPSATFHTTIEEGCRALTESGDVVRVSDATALADNAWMARRLGGRYRSAGIGECDRSPVLVVGVASPLVDVPVAGPRGTSVIAYWQPPIEAFGE